MDAAAIARRAAGLLLRPTATWASVADEATPTRELLSAYVGPLAAIPAICGMIGGALEFGVTEVSVHQGVLTHGLKAVAGFGLTLASVWLAGHVLSRLAGLFGGRADAEAGLRLAAYAATPLWLAGVLYLVPGLLISAALLGVLWSFFLLYRGLTPVLGVPEGRLLNCFAAALIAIGLIAMLRGGLVDLVAELGGPLSLS